MTAIEITQELKDLNISLFKNDIVGEIKQLKEIPKIFFSPTYFNGQRTDGYHTLDVSIHEADGFYEVVEPVFDSTTHYLGSLFFDVDKFTYEVILLTTEELQNRVLEISERNKQVLIQAETEKQILETAQSFDDTNALDSADLFPLWEVGFAYTIGFKCKHFTVDNEIVLYKCVQAHTSQADWQPKDVPALFTRVAYPNQILDFVQPTGAQDAYNIGDQVLFNGSVYESLINANVWSPTTYPQGWQLIP